MPKGQYGFRARVSKLHPPPLIEETVRGVVVMPPDTESVRLVFDRTGRLVRYTDVPAKLVINAVPDTIHYLAFPHYVKTSGSPVSHAAICALLRMLQRKFMTNLQVNDDTGYWTTGDIEILVREHAEMGAVLGIFNEFKNVGAMLRALGVEVPVSGKIEQLDPNVRSLPPQDKKKTSLN
jgi:hypothetical protein